MPRKKNTIHNSQRKDIDIIAKKISETFEKEFPKKYDRSLRDYRDKIKVLYSRKYDENVSDIKSEKNDKVFKALKLGHSYRKRRISAFVDIAAEAAEKYDEQYPDICIEEELSKFCSSLEIRMPDVVDEYEDITVAAALFILDSIEKSGNYDVAVYFIPHDERIEDVELPLAFQDSVFSNDVIKGVVYLIKNRHGSDDTYYSPETASLTAADKSCFCEYRQHAPVPTEKIPEDIISRFLLDEYDKDEFIQIHDYAEKLSDRERYYALLSFIRPEITERAAKRFHDKCMDFIDIILDTASIFKAKSLKIAEESLNLVSEMVKIAKQIEECEQKMMNRVKQFRNTKNMLSILSNPEALNSANDNDVMLSSEMDILIRKREENARKIEEKTRDLYIITLDLEERFDDITDAMVINANYVEPEIIKNFNVKNPYELIFGFLYAIDSADSMAWCAQVVECVLGYAGQLLPWNAKENEEFFDKVTSVIYNTTDVLEKKAEKRRKQYEEYLEDDEDKYEDEYTMKYSDAFQFVRENFKYHKEDLLPYNLAQIIYTNSNVVPPRYARDRYESVQSFVKSGFSRKAAEIMCYYKGFADVHNDGKLGFDRVTATENLIKERSAEGSDQISIADHMKIMADKNAEIEELKKKLYSSERKAADFEKQISGIHEKYESDNQELLELRNLIYKIQNSSEDEEEQHETGITFPYRTNARVVVFGGHATWLKVIVKLLPNVKFIDPYADPDVNTIRNADVVWMQTNAMPHNKYSKIMEIVRMKKIPVKYFAYASAEKCAVQLAEYDTEEI